MPPVYERAPSVELEATTAAVATLLASATGASAYMTNRRAKRIELHMALDAAEVDGWKTLIESLMVQYTAAAAEAQHLRERLKDSNDKYDALVEEFHRTRADHHAQLEHMEKQLADAHDRIAILERIVEGRRATDGG